MDELDDCDKVIFVKGGRIIAQGEPSDLKRKMPGTGKIVSATLEKVSDELVTKLEKIGGIRKVIQEGRTLKIVMDIPSTMEIGKKIEEFGGIIEEIRVEKVGMREVFIYYIGEAEE
jgi:ABC-type multidrug transport system ATPase subunit